MNAARTEHDQEITTMTTTRDYPTDSEFHKFALIRKRVRVSSPDTSVSSYSGALGTVIDAIARSADGRLVWWQVKLDDGRTQLFFGHELTKI